MTEARSTLRRATKAPVIFRTMNTERARPIYVRACVFACSIGGLNRNASESQTDRPTVVRLHSLDKS